MYRVSNHPQWGWIDVPGWTWWRRRGGAAASLPWMWPGPAVPGWGRPHEAGNPETHKNVISLLPNPFHYAYFFSYFSSVTALRKTEKDTSCSAIQSEILQTDFRWHTYHLQLQRSSDLMIISLIYYISSISGWPKPQALTVNMVINVHMSLWIMLSSSSHTLLKKISNRKRNPTLLTRYY
mgnify:CR=1 FL=1